MADDLKFEFKLEHYKWFTCTRRGGDGDGEEEEEGVFKLRREKKKVKIEKEYPPPIPGLAKTENVPSSQMPWVMKRYYTSDGRLIIKEEKIERFEYFEAHRTNGRLMLNLVPLNEHDLDCSDDDDDGDDDDDDGGGDVVEVVDRTVAAAEKEEENESALVNGGGSGGGATVIGGGGSGGVKCSSLCTFGVAVPAIRC
ncbi:hypothetical protein FXO38_07816 [Capsicum annuum]|uniref:uncharacterized protein LOC107869555 n=1 Tax=Capsicum annuum TaxID=4072 RepID=UPI0007BFA723|nr:uncharacterized protein LOC107869555 [Capsicum annuum]KAF3668980.1 hypothetical protein FXO38_07816 [Capsicum annuum]